MTQRLYVEAPHAFKLLTVNIREADEDELKQISLNLGLALNLSEMKKVQAYFSRIKRNATDVELQTIG